MGATGLSQSLWTLLFFPPLQRRWGTGGVLRACANFWPVFFALPPFSNFLLRRDLIAPFWIFGPVATVIGTGVSIAFSKNTLPAHHSRHSLIKSSAAVQLALNDIAPSQSTLGTLNGVALSVSAALRSIAPALFTSIFAIGVKQQILWGYLAWAVLVLMGVTLAFTMRGLPAEAEGKINVAPAEETG